MWPGLIEDGAVLQTGIGGIPDAILPMLMDRKDLGVHSEMISDGVIPLIEAGVLTGARKNFKPRKIILGFALGTKRLFEFVDNNPIFEFHPTAYTNDPGLIARNDKMVAINSALQVDLTGQVCSDSIGNQFYSGHWRAGRFSAREQRAPRAASRSSRFRRPRSKERFHGSCPCSIPGREW